MSGHPRGEPAGRRAGGRLPWLYSIVGLSLAGWALLAGAAYLIGRLTHYLGATQG